METWGLSAIKWTCLSFNINIQHICCHNPWMSRQRICCSCYAIHARATYRRLGGCWMQDRAHQPLTYKCSTIRRSTYNILRTQHRHLDCSPLHGYTTIVRSDVSTDIDVQRPNNSTLFPESIKSLPHPSILVVIVEGCDGISACWEDENLIVLTVLLR